MNFSSKELNQYQTVSEILSAARQERGVELDKAERTLKISKKYLVALERGDYQKLPSAIYVKNFTKVYAKFLGLNVAEVLEQLQRELDITEKINGEEPIIKNYEAKNTVLITPRAIRNFIVIIISLALLAYLAWQINAIFAPPALAVNSPEDDITISDNSFTIVGQTEPEVQIKINNQEILADQQGNFTKQLDLQTGLNTIEITAQKKHSRPSTVIRRIMVERSDEDLPTPPTDASPIIIDENLINSGQ